MTLISIVVPCYNQAQYLDECLLSVYNQTYSNWECIIVNDGSPDHTHDIVQHWLNKDSRYKYLKIDNGGVSNARNLGIENAIGEFILPLDADDKIGSEYLELAIPMFQKFTHLKVVYCKAEKFGDESGEWLLEPFTLERLAIANMIFSAAIFRKADWVRIDGYDIRMDSGLEDWEFWINMLKDDGEVLRIDKVCFYYRIKKSSRQSDLRPVDQELLLEYISIKHADFFVKCFGSFKKILHKNDEIKNKLNSEKFIIDLFCSKFFGFRIFGKKTNVKV